MSFDPVSSQRPFASLSLSLASLSSISPSTSSLTHLSTSSFFQLLLPTLLHPSVPPSRPQRLSSPISSPTPLSHHPSNLLLVLLVRIYSLELILFLSRKPDRLLVIFGLDSSQRIPRFSDGRVPMESARRFRCLDSRTGSSLLVGRALVVGTDRGIPSSGGSRSWVDVSGESRRALFRQSPHWLTYLRSLRLTCFSLDRACCRSGCSTSISDGRRDLDEKVSCTRLLSSHSSPSFLLLHLTLTDYPPLFLSALFVFSVEP